jgi:hypothetical protein
MTPTYRILDEPTLSPLASFAVNPMWIVLATILLQPLAWAWFLFNSFALGSPTRRREVLSVAIGLGLLVVLGRLPGWAEQQGLLTAAGFKPYAPYWQILQQFLVLGVSYRLFLYQAVPHQIFRHLRGR